jgi:hypothetical protein
MTTYLALYTGPNGPISHTFDAADLDEAREHVKTHGKDWYDAAADALDIDPDSATLDVDIEDALRGEWTLAVLAEHDGAYALYQPYVLTPEQARRAMRHVNGRATY